MDRRIRQHKSRQAHVSTRLAIFGEDDFVEMRGHGHVRRVADDFVRDAPFPVGRISARKVEGACNDAHGGVVIGEPAAEIFEVRPVVSVEAVSYLRAHVAEQEGLVQSCLTPFCVCGGDLVAPIVA